MLNRVRLPGEVLETMFNQEAGQTVLIRCRAWPDNCTDWLPVCTWLSHFISLSLYCHMFLPSQTPLVPPFPHFVFCTKRALLSITQSWNALPQHSIPPQRLTPLQPVRWSRDPLLLNHLHGFHSLTVRLMVPWKWAGSCWVRMVCFLWSGYWGTLSVVVMCSVVCCGDKSLNIGTNNVNPNITPHCLSGWWCSSSVQTPQRAGKKESWTSEEIKLCRN